jgi:hypothetical protein
MRISNTLKREMYEGVTLGYRNPEWFNPDKSHWPHSMLRQYKEDCISNPDDEYRWENMLLGHLCEWTDLVEERGGTLDFVLFIMKWFTTEDILYYSIAFDSDGTYMLSYYNEDRNSRVKLKPGRWFLSHYNRDEKIVRMFAKEWSQMVMKCQDIYSRYYVQLFDTSEAIVHRYKTFHRTDLSSCCSHPDNQYATGGEHPCKVYGGDSGVTLAVIKDLDGKDFARTLLYNGKYIRIYPTGRSHEHSVAKGVLQHHNLATGCGNLDGAELNFVPHGDCESDDMVVCPYLDGDASIVWVGERENGDMCLRVGGSQGSHGNLSIDTQNGNLHERGCFDSATMRINGDDWDYYCSQCEEGFNDNGIHLDDGNFCGDECAVEYGFVLAYVGYGDMEWCKDYDVHYDNNSGDYYTERGLSYAELVLTDRGQVAKQADCVHTSAGWYLSVDCLFVNTAEEYLSITLEQVQTPVWMARDGSGEVVAGTYAEFVQHIEGES